MNQSKLLYLAIPSMALTLSCKEKKAEENRPNILFIMTDDHAYQAISAFGYDLIQTPNIDRLAQEGMLFNNSFVTNSISAPSRATLLTGKYSHVNGKIDNKKKFDVSQQTFTKILRKSGYQTAMVGKWHLEANPDSADFDYWKILPGQGNYYNPDFIAMSGETHRDSGYATDLITDYAMDWLDKRDKSKPFCMLLHHKAPHRNWMPDLKYLNLFDKDTFPVPVNFFDSYDGRTAAAEQEMSILNDMTIVYDLKMNGYKSAEEPNWTTDQWNKIIGRMSEEQRTRFLAHYDSLRVDLESKNLNTRQLARWKFQRYMRDYLACVKSVDDNIGRVLKYLDENGLAENTIVVYTSDQGFYLGEHGWFDKRFMYEESFRMPLLVRYPAEVKAGSVSDELVLNLDFASTFLDYAGIEIPADIQGESFRSILKGETPAEWRKSVYYHYYEYPAVHMVKRHYGIRTQQYKLIHFYHDIDQWELYDLEKDAAEMNNLINDPAYTTIIVNLKEELKKLMEKYGDSDELAREMIEK